MLRKFRKDRSFFRALWRGFALYIFSFSEMSPSFSEILSAAICPSISAISAP